MSIATTTDLATRQNPFTPKPDLKIWMDGELVPVAEARISIFDHGLLYGDGVFEGIRIYGGKIFKEQEHLRRLFESANAIRLKIPMTAEEISDAMYKAIDANGLTGLDGYIRLIVTRGIGLLGIAISKAACPSVAVIADKISLYPPEVYDRGLKCVVSSYVRNHPNSISPRVKSLNYLNNIMAKAEAVDAGADEAVMLNVYGRVAECTGDNIFIVRDGVLHTPAMSECILDGITRKVVMELARRRGIDVRESMLLRHDLFIADECFATGTAAELVPITFVENRPIGSGKSGEITKMLLQDFVAYRSS